MVAAFGGGKKSIHVAKSVSFRRKGRHEPISSKQRFVCARHQKGASLGGNNSSHRPRICK